jgi:hypothetical protein
MCTPFPGRLRDSMSNAIVAAARWKQVTGTRAKREKPHGNLASALAILPRDDEQDCRGAQKEVLKHAVARPPPKAAIHFPW